MKKVWRIIIPSKEKIQELKERIRKKLNQPEDFEFEGKINIDVRPNLTADLTYYIDIDKEPFELNIVIYSARYPSSYYNWEKLAISDIRLKIQYYRKLKEDERLKQQLKKLGAKID